VSYDLYVLAAPVELSADDVSAFLDADELDNSSRTNRAIEAFHAELTQFHPEVDDIPIDKIDDLDYCPWSCAMGRGPRSLVLNCVFSQAANVQRLVYELAAKHKLSVFNPQEGTLHRAIS
jgi:hypothetical protein